MITKNKKKILNYALTFIIPMILLMIVFALLKIYPFGDKDLLWFDTQAQYIDFLSYWQDVIRGQASVFYSFSKNLGGNMFGLYTYYLTSPVNLIIMLFSKIDLPTAFMIIILIKIGLCAVGFRYYLDNTKFIVSNEKQTDFKKIIFTTMYAMMSYNIVYCMSHMWLDCVALLPLIFLGIEKLIRENKWELYLVTLTLAIIANYYIAFMIALFTIPYYIYITACDNKDKKLIEIIKEKKSNIWLYIRISLISVLIAGIIIIPTIYSLVNSKGQLYSASSLTMYMYFDYFTLFAKNTLGAFSMSELRLGAPNIYAGLITLVLTVLYFFNNKIDKKEKIYTGIFLFLFFICFYFNPINLFLHMMQSPMSFPFRYSFIFSFLTLVMGYKCLNNLEDLNPKKAIAVCVGLVFIFMIVDRNSYEYLINWKVFISIVLIIIYTVYITKIENFKKMGHISLGILISFELVLSGYLLMNWMPYGDRNVYRNHIDQYTKVYEYVKGLDKGLYRIAYNNRKSLDDSMMYNFAGMEHYSSVGEKSTESFLNLLGYEGSPLVEYSKGTILDNSILGVKYLLLTNTTDFYMHLQTVNDINVYENPYALPFGYVVSKDILEYNKKYVFANPFEYQNYIFGLMTGEEENYYDKAEYEIKEYNNLNIIDYADSMQLSLVDANNPGYIDIVIKTKNKPIYTYLPPEIRGGMVSFIIENEEIQVTESNITYIGCREDEVVLKIMVYGQINLSKNFMYYLDNELIVTELTKLSNKSLDIIENKDNYIKGEITVEEDEVLFTTIPYEDGWTIKINGKEVKPIKILDTFIGINIAKGANTIEFEYTSPGITTGILLTIIGIVLLGLEIIVKYLSGLDEKKLNTNKKTKAKAKK